LECHAAQHTSQLNEAPAPHQLAKTDVDYNAYRFVTLLEVARVEDQLRIPNGILYINGLPLVFFKFKGSGVTYAPDYLAQYRVVGG